ncbi:hypothetical protein NU219Hw_g1669t1 [Hortaea werneckii]
MAGSDIEMRNSTFLLGTDLSFTYEDRAVPTIQEPKQVIVRIVATGVCGSDVHYWQHGGIGPYKVQKPIVLGHESAGIVVSCGESVKSFAATPPYDGTLSTRLEFASKKGATHTFKMRDAIPNENAIALLASLGEPSGSDIVIDATGAQPCIKCGIESLRRGGTFVQAGLGSPKITFPVGLICDKEAIFRGSFRYGPGDYKLAIASVASGRVDLDGFVTQTFPFLEAQGAFETVLQKQGIKSVIWGPGVEDGQY